MLGELAAKDEVHSALDVNSLDGIWTRIWMIVIAFLSPYCVEPRRKW
jgi:hypothetical protein